MVRVRLILLLSLVSILCNAQSIEKRYSSHLSNTGVIYFFHPKKLQKNANIDMFMYDMTYVSHGDSLTLNCSVRIRNGNNIKSLNLKSGNHDIYADGFSIMYREVRKHGYEIRATSRFSFNEIKNAFKEQTPIVFEMTLNDGSHCMASYGKSAWKKESYDVTRILESLNF